MSGLTVRQLSDPSISAERLYKTTTCSNVPFLEAVWTTAKRCNKVVELRRHTGLVDIVAENGLEWIKVSTINEHRLLMEMAKQGWENSSSDEDDDDNYENVRPYTSDSDDDDGLSLQKMAEKLMKAAKSKRIRYRYPQIRFVLPKVHEGRVPEIDNIIKELRTMGTTVQCAGDIAEMPSLEAAISHMAIDAFEDLSPTVNIDCTILLAIISDISHGKVEEQPWFNRAVRRQIEIEAEEQLMLATLWPAMEDRGLVCTHEAAQRMREITDLIGTDSEKARMRIMMGDDTTKSPDQLRKEFQKYSEHQIPSSWKLPIRIDTTDIPSLLDSLPKVAAPIAPQLSPINQSVFLYGWAKGWTVLTSNRTVSKQIETLIEANRTEENEIGPTVWLCPTSRSLVAKERDRKGV